MKILNTYLYSYLAHLDMARLKDEGIEVFIKDDNIVSIDPVFAQAAGGIKLLVYEKDYDKAIEILKSNDYDNLKNEFPEEEISKQRKCKKCGSINIFQKGSWIMGLTFLILLFIPVTKKKSKFVCLDCSYQWKE